MSRWPQRYLHLLNETWGCLALNNTAAQVSRARSEMFHTPFEIMLWKCNEQHQARGFFILLCGKVSSAVILNAGGIHFVPNLIVSNFEFLVCLLVKFFYQI